MKSILFTLFVMVLAAVSPLMGDETHNGGGMAEQNFTFARLRIQPAIDYCLHLHCVKEPSDLLLLNQISSELKHEQENLVFKSSKLNPEIFYQSSQFWPKEISTEPEIGSPIYIDIDSIYKRTNNEQKPFSVSEAVKSLVFAFAFHHPKFTIETSLRVAHLLSQVAEMRTSESVAVRINRPYLRLMNWNFNPYPSRIAIFDAQKERDLTTDIQANLICLKESVAMNGFTIHGLFWTDPLPWNELTNTQGLSLSGEISYFCSNAGNKIKMAGQFRLIISYSTFSDQMNIEDPHWIEHLDVELRMTDEPITIIISDLKETN